MPVSKPITDLSGPHNRCVPCGFFSTVDKYCPFCGVETEHVPPQRRCSNCTEAVYISGAKFCTMCGTTLSEVSADLQADALVYGEAPSGQNIIREGA